MNRRALKAASKKSHSAVSWHLAVSSKKVTSARAALRAPRRQKPIPDQLACHDSERETDNIEARRCNRRCDLGIRRYLLHRHLAHWHPISTTPHNQALEIRALEENGLFAIPFSCQQTNANEWINTDLGTRVYMRPVRWRIWQKAKSVQLHRSMIQ